MSALRSASPWVVAGVVSAAAGFVALIIAARSLTVEDNAAFLVFWSVVFALTGSLSGMQGETSRAMTVPDADGAAGVRPGGTPGAVPRGARLMTVSLGVGVLCALAVVGTGFWWAPALLGSGPTGGLAALLPIGLALVVYAGQSGAVGGLIGRRDAVGAATIVGAEGAGRVLAFGVAGLAALGTSGFWWAAVVPMVLWVGVLAALGSAGRVWAMRADEDARRFVRNCLLAVGGGAGTSLLVNGYPTFLKATNPAADPGDLARTILAITLTRAPLLMPLLAFQGLVVSYLVRRLGRLRPTVARLLAVLWAGVAVVAAGMWLLGPWVMRTFYGPAYDVDGVFMALVTVGAGCTATLVVAAATALSVGRHAAFVGAWWVGTGASLALLLVPQPLAAKVLLSLMIGPLAGTAAALLALRGRAQTDADLTTAR